MQIRVYYEDTDLGGVVYHANYLKFCERARSEAFFKRDLLPHNEQGHFFIKDLYANYLKSAKLGDLLEVTSTLIEIKSASFKLHQEVLKEGVKLFEMDITIVHVNAQSNIKKFSKEQKEFLCELFKENSPQH
ncbi:MAG: YbgC/FadM family acyl-CoA thioesterase [Epsilonproteobacteria bacterium]|nr:YbgC/FadM family acyl-CoA thioesterase [Campylobacterota bacterium]